ncbi:hypothetical protein [Acidovorax sp. NCPPB 4044]|uniref:hypothetical protein n=1 Tax=Acidovorax sp. NCPPB 4044 TaxID=2940490 RepID=UPI0023036D8B|nr:hypothetical protein [Acidovorax sp. NCPPB 4044]MDA8522314.1 hypothetical protein [Acidovorax sp. NCPPB 4044]
METKPTSEQALMRLRLDADLTPDLPDAIEQANAEAVAYLDGNLYGDEAAMIQAADVRGIVVTPDIIAAQLLLLDAALGNNAMQDRESKRSTAFSMLRRHRNMGA